MTSSQGKLIVGKISEGRTTSAAEHLRKDDFNGRISSVEDPLEISISDVASARPPLDERPNSPMTLARYREVIAFALSDAHDFPVEAIEDLMSRYENVIRGSWSVGAVAADVIKLLYAEWHTFRTESRT